MLRTYILAILFLPFVIPGTANAQTGATPVRPPKYDLSKDPVLYTVGYAHLDTEWRWDYDETVRIFLKNTLDDNFSRFEKYRPYVFTFSGARRYKMMKEYYPEKYERLKKYVAQGRWFVGGSSVDECDVNVPSPESVIRQVLYGNGFFRSEFGQESVDFLLPDCFGFQAHLPSVLAHAGLKGFSTQKLSWGSASGIPFNIGNWTGPDGNGIVAALNATDYTGEIEPRLDTASYWVERVMENGKKYGVFADYRYYGVGDQGGAPREADVKNAVGSIGQPGGEINVYLSSSDQLFRDLTDGQRSALPSYSGDLLLTEHSSGSLTSQAYMKRWNRLNEQLALAAEPAAVMADWLGGIAYPRPAVNEAWWLVLGSQMHDILPGTSIPKAYEYAWNDEVLAMNRFAAVLEHSAGAVIRAMDTRVTGVALVVYNPLAVTRKDIAEAEVRFPGGVPKAVKVLDPSGKEVPVQILGATKESMRILFPCTVPSCGFQCYDVQEADKAAPAESSVAVSQSTLENEFLKVTVNAAGDIASIIDKRLGKELLSAPAGLEFQREHPEYWPAWNMDWNDRKMPPLGRVGGPAVITVEEKGPVRVSLKIVRSAMNSRFTQYLQLAAGRENLLVRNTIDWQSEGVSLKAAFPLTASNGVATYNLGMGTIERGNNNEKKYEVPSREWFDLTDRSGSFGVTIIEDSKFGSDKPGDRMLRLTLLHTPKTNFYHDQATQDWGIHEVTYGIYSHKGDWRIGLSEWQGRGLNQPLRVFATAQHPGFLGRSFSFAGVSVPQVDIRTIKKAENGKDVILRLQELVGKDIAEVEVTLAGKILKAWEVDGQERLVGDATIRNGKLVISMKRFTARSFAVQMEAPPRKLAEPVAYPLPLAFDADVVSSDRNRKNGGFGDSGQSFPAGLFPGSLVVDGIPFNLGPTVDGKNNALVCRGQKISLPDTGQYDHIYILAAAVTDTAGTFRAGGAKTTLRVGSFRGRIGQFDNRTWDKYGRMTGLQAGFIRRDEVAWFATHLNCDTAALPYRYGYIFKYGIGVPEPGGVLQLPDNESIRVFAVTLAENPSDKAAAARPLYDDFAGRQPLVLNIRRSYVTESMAPLMKVTCFRNRELAGLPARLTMKDYADIHQPNGVTVIFLADTTLTGSPTPSGSTTPSGSPVNVPALNDGMYDLLPGDSVGDKWTEKGEGRILMDLQNEIEIDSIHIFTEQSTRRGGQSFSIWGATGRNAPAAEGDPSAAGWKFLALAPPENIWGNSKALYTALPLQGETCRYRYLLWVSEHSAYGPFYFREVDVFEKQK